MPNWCMITLKHMNSFSYLFFPRVIKHLFSLSLSIYKPFIYYITLYFFKTDINRVEFF
jgi:hypothetical protein